MIPPITRNEPGEGLGLTRLLAYLPRGNTLDDRAWQKRHVFLQGLLLLHLPLLFVFGVFMGRSAWDTMMVLTVPAACLVAGRLIRHRRVASVLITAGLTYCSAVLVTFSGGSIEAHFHFFIMIGFIALYQDWVPFLWNVGFTVLSHGLGSALRTNLIFSHPAGQTSPWVWSAIHGAAVLAACCGVVIFWETTEREQRKTLALTKQLADAEITRRRFTSDLLVNLARRNQSLLYRQLGLINQLEDQAEDPDALADLFRLDHLATRIRRNAESLLVLSGEEPPRTWGRPVALVDVVRAAIAETEDLDRVVFAVDERLATFGNAVADLTHLVAELVENAVHFSPPEANVIIRTRPYLQVAGAHVLTVEDWGVGMRPEDMAAANDLLAAPRDVDLSVSQRLGLHVVARLAQRHGIQVSLTPTPGCGVTAAVVLPPSLFADADAAPGQAPDETEGPVGVVPALAGSATAAPAADLPLPPPPPTPPSWAPPVEQWIDLTDGPAGGRTGRFAANGHETTHQAPDGPAPNWAAEDGPAPNWAAEDGLAEDGPALHGPVLHGPVLHGPGENAADDWPAEEGADWSGWWEPSPADLQDGQPLSPIAARPPLAERVQPPHPSAPEPRPSVPEPHLSVPERHPGAPEPHLSAPGPHQGVPEPHPAAAAPPEGERSQWRDSVPPAVHSPQPADGVLLSRRVPQAHLAPELRRNGQAPAPGGPEGSLPDAAEARAALSRYQASRQAARAVVDDGGSPGGAGEAGAEPASGGGWS